jgi:hypothetical protein
VIEIVTLRPIQGFAASVADDGQTILDIWQLHVPDIVRQIVIPELGLQRWQTGCWYVFIQVMIDRYLKSREGFRLLLGQNATYEPFNIAPTQEPVYRYNVTDILDTRYSALVRSE